MTQENKEFFVLVGGFFQAACIVFVAYLSGAVNFWGLAVIFFLASVQFGFEARYNQIW